MKITSVFTTTTHIVDVDGLSYVRNQYIRFGETVVTWKRNFDWKDAPNPNLILNDLELEKRYSLMLLQRFQEAEEHKEEVVTQKPLPPASRMLKEGDVPTPPQNTKY